MRPDWCRDWFSCNSILYDLSFLFLIFPVGNNLVAEADRQPAEHNLQGAINCRLKGKVVAQNARKLKAVCT